jgi:hypothetical protein
MPWQAACWRVERCGGVGDAGTPDRSRPRKPSTSASNMPRMATRSVRMIIAEFEAMAHFTRIKMIR